MNVETVAGKESGQLGIAGLARRPLCTKLFGWAGEAVEILGHFRAIEIVLGCDHRAREDLPFDGLSLQSVQSLLAGELAFIVGFENDLGEDLALLQLVNARRIGVEANDLDILGLAGSPKRVTTKEVSA